MLPAECGSTPPACIRGPALPPLRTVRSAGRCCGRPPRRGRSAASPQSAATGRKRQAVAGVRGALSEPRAAASRGAAAGGSSPPPVAVTCQTWAQGCAAVAPAPTARRCPRLATGRGGLSRHRRGQDRGGPAGTARIPVHESPRPGPSFRTALSPDCGPGPGSGSRRSRLGVPPVPAPGPAGPGSGFRADASSGSADGCGPGTSPGDGRGARSSDGEAASRDRPLGSGAGPGPARGRRREPRPAPIRASSPLPGCRDGVAASPAAEQRGWPTRNSAGIGASAAAPSRSISRASCAMAIFGHASNKRHNSADRPRRECHSAATPPTARPNVADCAPRAFCRDTARF